MWKSLKAKEDNRERKRAVKELAEVDGAHVDEAMREATVLRMGIILEQKYHSF